jgi:hypothetical protein
MKDTEERELWLCSQCGHEVNESDEFCMACESIFVETNLTARQRFGKRSEDAGAATKAVKSHEIGYTFA